VSRRSSLNCCHLRREVLSGERLTMDGPAGSVARIR
jgi:hypothetical protein